MTVRTGGVVLQGVSHLRHEPTPWLYPTTHPAYAPDWPYTLVVSFGGFMQRVYDWEGRPVRIPDRFAFRREGPDAS